MVALARAPLPIHVAVVGGSLAGLATALALARVGHTVTVLEQLGEDEAGALPAGGLRLMPNATRILESWGLSEQLALIAEDSRVVRLYTYGEGEYMGANEWHDALLRECGGQTLNVGYAELRTLLLIAARAHGVAVRFGARVVAIDSDKAWVTLEGGQVIEADVVVGADGARGVTRATLFNGVEDIDPGDMVVFNTTVPFAAMEAEPELGPLLVDAGHAMWMGDGAMAFGFPLRPTGAYALHVYVPRARVPDAPASWGAAGAPPALLQAALSAAEPRLTKLAALARPAALVAYAQHETLDEDDWVLPRAPCAALGDAAHPMPPGSIQAAALSIEDAAVFARLFARLRRPAQVPGLLATFGMLRAERTRLTHAADAENIAYLSLAHGAGAAEARDDKLRENLRSGRGAIGGTDPDDAGVQAQWIQILTTWGYDAEDDADNWWVKWGALGEPADVPMLDLGAAIRVDVRAEPT